MKIICIFVTRLILPWRYSSRGPRPPHCRGFTITVGRTPLDEWSARRRDLYLTTHNTHKWQKILAPAGFEPTILASERPQTHDLDRAATGIGTGWDISGAFNKQSRNMTIIFFFIYMSVHPSAWNSVPPSWRVFAKFLVWNFYYSLSKYSDFDTM